MSTTLLVPPSSWIAVEPVTLSGQDGAPIAATCQNVLDTNGLKDDEEQEGSAEQDERPVDEDRGDEYWRHQRKTRG